MSTREQLIEMAARALAAQGLSDGWGEPFDDEALGGVAAAVIDALGIEHVADSGAERVPVFRLRGLEPVRASDDPAR